MERMVYYCDCGADGLLKLNAAVGMMMDCCQFQEYAETKFSRYLKENHTAVFLSSLQMNILRFPSFREKLKVKVVIYDGRAFYGYRRLTIRDEKGQLCMIGNGIGCFYNFQTEKVVKLPENIGDYLTFDPPEEMDCPPRKIPFPTVEEKEVTTIKVTPSMLDPNGHLTSAEYFTIACDALPEEFQYNKVRIEYKQQVKKGTLLKVLLYKVTEKTFVIALKDPQEVLHALVEFVAE